MIYCFLEASQTSGFEYSDSFSFYITLPRFSLSLWGKHDKSKVLSVNMLNASKDFPKPL